MLDLEQSIEREWLEGRFLVLELAALLDRLDVAGSSAPGRDAEDPRIAALRRALQELPITRGDTGRCERILHIYSELAVPRG